MDAGALDDLDLDDMFNDDGDMLFDGLDIELDGTMGDIISDENNKEKSQVIPPVPTPAATPTPRIVNNKRSGGPRTKRTNPMIEKDERGKITEPATTNKRRKTKRKMKSPNAFTDDDGPSTVEEQPRKKRKATTKAKKGTGDINTALSTAAVTSKVSILPSTSSVSVTGQLGVRGKRGGSTKGKRKLKKSSADNKTSENPSLPDPVITRMPKLEPTFCGLKPSKKFYYPFLESVPVESSMPKRKNYPLLDKMTSALTNHTVNTSKNLEDTEPIDVTEDSPIFKLMFETYGADNRDKQKSLPENRDALLRGISHLRKIIAKSNKNDLARDIVGICGLLTREHNFLSQTLDNMKTWCKNEFDNEKYKETYQSPVEELKISKWKCPVVRVQITCSGYKGTKNKPLFAILPTLVLPVPKAKLFQSSSSVAASKFGAVELKKSVLVTSSSIPSSAFSITSSSITNKKKRREKTINTNKLKFPMLASPVSAPPPPKTYADSTPLLRRQQIIERISQLALELENTQQKENMVGRLDPIPEEEPHLHTTRMWEWLQSTGFYTNSLASKRLAAIRFPDIHSRKPSLSIPSVIQGVVETTHQVSSDSLFDRLQSLLIEEDVDNEDSDTSDYDEEDSLDFLDDDDDTYELKKDDAEIIIADDSVNLNFADVSSLSIEERTFIQLSHAGLIKKSLYLEADLVVSSTEKRDGRQNNERGLDNIIDEMSTDLARLTSTNNCRISFLETVTTDANICYSKQIKNDEATVIAKCQSLLKRSKEKAKKAKQKKDDNLNLPW